MRSNSIHKKLLTSVISGDSRTVVISNRYAPDPSKPAVIYAGAFGSGAGNVLFFQTAIELAKRGYIVGCTDAGDSAGQWLGSGPGVWGNDTSIARFDSLLSYLQSQHGANTEATVVLYGSHGAALAFNWARQHLGDVSCICGAIGSVDVEYIRANDLLSHQDDIEAAYTNLAGWTAARPTHNPVEYAGELANIPTRLYYGPADTLCPQSTQEEMADGIGASAELVSLGAGVGHDTTNLDGVGSADWVEEQVMSVAESAIALGKAGTIPAATAQDQADFYVTAPYAMRLYRIKAICKTAPSSNTTIQIRRSTDSGGSFSNAFGTVTINSGAKTGVADPTDLDIAEGDVLNFSITAGGGSGADLLVELVGRQVTA